MKKILTLLSACLLVCACNNNDEPAGPAEPLMNKQDSLAIVAFYHSMKCAEWKGGFHWDLKDYTTWGGITAVLDTEKNEYRITEIEVPDAKRFLPDGYSLPAELADLTALRSLIVWGDERAEGGIPEEIFNCPLDTLYAIGAGFQASVPQRLWTRSYTSAHPFSVGPNDSSQSNPDLNDNWENQNAIYLNVVKPSGGSESVTAPWANGSSSILDTTFRYDTKKEDGWQMLFHTFKEATYEAEQENYMCFYNPNTGIIKMLYFYEPNSHYEGFEKVLTCIKNGKVTFADDTIEANGILVFPNKLSSTEEQVYCGWNGFMYQVPQQDANAEPRTSILIANN